MKKLEHYLSTNPNRAFFILMALAVPAFIINLGLLPLFADEPTRANVALEMILSGNYSVPTIGGEYYYNKPPLYNWLLAGTYLLSGSFSEFSTRLPAVIPMFLYSISIFYAVRFFLQDSRIALLSGMLFLLNGRMLIYDSMLGHIDIFYSWLTFISFMLIFYFHQREKWFLLFFFSYLITAVTFLSKGLPSIVFQGITLVTWLSWNRQFKKLFSWQHILSGLICLMIIAAYFLNYYSYNPDLEGYLSTIWDQSSRRTVVETNIWTSIIHILKFPFEHIGHLFPASLLLLFCFHKKFIQGIRENRFLSYISIIFIANIFVYWLSPQTRPRYLLMLYPLLFIIWSHAYFTYRHQLPKLNNVFQLIILILGLAVTLAVPAVLFMDDNQFVSFPVIKVSMVITLSGLCTLAIWKFREYKILPFLALLLVVRLAFSLFVLPYRELHKEESYFKRAAIEAGALSKGESFYFYRYHPAEAMIPFHDRLIFYIQRERLQKVKFVEEVQFPGYYFTFDRDLNHPGAVLIKEYRGLKLYHLK